MSVRLPKKAVELLRDIVTFDSDCASQADVLLKYLPDIRATAKKTHEQEQLKDRVEIYSDWSKLDLAAFTLKLAKWQTIWGRSFKNALEFEEFKLDKKAMVARIAKVPIAFYTEGGNEFLCEFENEKGKYQGLAKRKWPELKESK